MIYAIKKLSSITSINEREAQLVSILKNFFDPSIKMYIFSYQDNEKNQDHFIIEFEEPNYAKQANIIFGNNYEEGSSFAHLTISTHYLNFLERKFTSFESIQEASGF